MRVLTLTEDVHGVIDLNVHVITNCREFVPFRADEFSILIFYLVVAAALFGKPTRNCDGVSINIGFESIFSLILECNCNFGPARFGFQCVDDAAAVAEVKRTIVPPG